MKALQKLRHWIAQKLSPETHKITPDQLREIAQTLEDQARIVEGDGKAVFLEDMTEDEYDQYVLLENRGWKKFYKQLGLTKDDQPED